MGHLSDRFGLRSHLFNVGYTHKRICRVCLQELEAARHFLCECDKLVEIKRVLSLVCNGPKESKRDSSGINV